MSLNSAIATTGLVLSPSFTDRFINYLSTQPRASIVEAIADAVRGICLAHSTLRGILFRSANSHTYILEPALGWATDKVQNAYDSNKHKKAEQKKGGYEVLIVILFYSKILCYFSVRIP